MRSDDTAQSDTA